MKSVVLTYTGSSGNVYDLKTKGLIRTKTANFHAYEWKMDVTKQQYGVTVDRFTRDPATYQAVLIFDGTYENNKEMLERLHADFERDILNNTPGKLTWGDCSIDTFVYSSSTEPGDIEPDAKNTVKFYCPRPFWVQEKKISIFAHTPEILSTDKAYDYQYDYSYVGMLDQRVKFDTKHYAESDFRITAYGPFSVFNVNISGNIYRVEYEISTGEAMIIDSRQKGMYKGEAYVLKSDGSVANVFDYRSPSYQLFKRLPAGILTIDYSRTYGIDLSVFIERSEPIWNSSQ